MKLTSREPYNYSALYVGIIILAFGVGSIIGSLVGGKLSDMVLRRLKKANGGVMVPEVRRFAPLAAIKMILAYDRCVCIVPSPPCLFSSALSLPTPGLQASRSILPA